MATNCSWSIDDSRNKFQFGCEYGRLIEDGELTGVVRKSNYRGVSSTFWRSLAKVGDESTLQVMGVPELRQGRAEPGDASWGTPRPPCHFAERRGVRWVPSRDATMIAAVLLDELADHLGHRLAPGRRGAHSPRSPVRTPTSSASTRSAVRQAGIGDVSAAIGHRPHRGRPPHHGLEVTLTGDPRARTRADSSTTRWCVRLRGTRSPHSCPEDPYLLYATDVPLRWSEHRRSLAPRPGGGGRSSASVGAARGP